MIPEKQCYFEKMIYLEETFSCSLKEHFTFHKLNFPILWLTEPLEQQRFRKAWNPDVIAVRQIKLFHT